MRLYSQRVLLEGQLRPATLDLAGGSIASISPGRHAPDIDLGTRALLPGIVDLHGDAFERQWMPRANVFFPVEMALLETDRQLLANGITTAYHGLTVSWEPGLRGIEHGRQLVEALERMRPRLRADTRLHLRYEIYALEEAPALLEWIREGRVDLIGFNDHLEMIREHLGKEGKAGKYAERSGMSIREFEELLHRVRDRRADVPVVTRQIAAAARERGIPMASHDDETPARRAFYAALGASICEFPVDAETARAARAEGAEIILGGPNVVRGQSHANRMSARAAIAEGLATVLSSDYYYPSLFHAVAVLVRHGLGTLESLWGLVAENPARAAGLDDRGLILTGARADLVALDDSHKDLPEISAVWVEGGMVYSGEPFLANRVVLA